MSRAPAADRRATRPRLVAATVAVIALGGAVGLSAAGEAGGDPDRGRQPPQTQPNVVVVMTDEQTVETMRVMERLDRVLARRGVTFTNSFASNPICCPSRATFLTGQYAHNHGVLRNGAPHGGYTALDGSRTLAVWLRRAGYYTAHVGKYLNEYGQARPPTEVPPGWSEWYGAIDPTTYSMYGYTLNENGRLVTYGSPGIESPGAYQTDVFAAKAVDMIGRRAPKPRPFFLSVAPIAPHYEIELANPSEPRSAPNPRPAPRHAGAFATEPLPLPPSYNEADVSDKPEGIRTRKPFPPEVTESHTARYRARLASLLAVDEMIEAIVDELRRARELRRTVVVYTSDNGYLLGEHRIRENKQFVYEESVRVPLVIRGPGIPRGERRRVPVANIDLAPTILDFARAKANVKLDGRSLRRLLADRRFDPGRAIVLENWCNPDESCFDPTIPRYRAIRTLRFLYAEYPNGETELYDLEADRFQLTSLHADPAYAAQRGALADLLARLASCSGAGCRAEPRLRLGLSFRRGRMPRGAACAKSAVVARLHGSDAREALEAKFFIRRRRAGADPRAPLRKRIDRSRLHRSKRSEVGANVTVLDGRVSTATAKLPPRCPRPAGRAR